MNYVDSMIDKNLMNTSFQTFYVSKEESNCPLIANMVKISKKLEELNLLKNNKVIISLGYGKRVLINGNDTDLKNIERKDLLEIVDYDPVKKVVLIMGQKELNIETPVHWMIHHARTDVNVVVQINSEKIIEKLFKKLKTTEKEYPSGTLEQIKEIMKTLRTDNSIIIKNEGVLFTGKNFQDVEDLINKTCGDITK